MDKIHTEAFLLRKTETLKKSERLCSKKAFEFLFAKGKNFFNHPVKITYAKEKSDNPSIQVAFGASKRNYKKAVHRNRIKRILRDIYRKNKLEIIEGYHQYLMISYISKEIDPYPVIETSLTKTLNDIQAYNKKHS
jgi:ribonuclease P protein component